MKVTVYVEGGGPKSGPSASADNAAACRRGFHDFFKNALGAGQQPRVVSSGSRDEAYEAYKDFARSLKTDPEVLALLLVDSEGPVPDGKTGAAYLRYRESHWKLLPERQAHLMVQCMESWFLVDKEALAGYYGQGFKENALPQNSNIEEISKKAVMDGLEAATRASKTKGEYHKTRHGFDILALIDPNKVKKASPFADALMKTLREKLTQ